MNSENISKLKADLLQLLKKEALKTGEFVLSSGKKSSYYLDGRLITLAPKGAYLIASLILEIIKENNISAIGGPTLGADPIVGAVAALSHLKNTPLKTFIVRKVTKAHGTQRQIEGPELSKDDKVLLIDDVATTGGALLEAAKALKEKGIDVKEALVIVDRREGASENLSREGIKLTSIFKLEDLGLIL